jgi:hyaluronan synthase/N-acetylglucosaminyltransferase
MYRAFKIAIGDIIVCIDSDTVIDTKAISEIVVPFSDVSVGCATGNIRVLNRQDNFLTKLCDLRYWLAFNIERTAQSLFGVMSCVSGPFGAYRRLVIDQVKDKWLDQRFLGNPCTFGDDRHLTNLVLALGYKSVYVPQAKAETESPAKIKNWLRQQLRWYRSFYREFIINTTWFKYLNPWLAFDLAYQAFFPLFLMCNLVIIFYSTFNQNFQLMYLWAIMVAFFGLIRALIGVFNTKDPEFIQFTFYGFIYILALLPLRIYALATVWKTNWR